MGEFIHYSVDAGVAVITIDRPERRNAMSYAVLRDFHEAVARASVDDEARAVVVTGAGGAFCAGTDLTDLAGTPEAERGSRAGDSGSPIRAAFIIMERLEGETIARRILREPRFEPVRPHLAHQCGEILARIHSVPLADLPGLPAPDPLDGCEEALRSLDEPYPVLELGLRWLKVHRPPGSPEPTVVHGDFRNGNLIIGEDGVRGVLDWEIVHAGADLSGSSSRDHPLLTMQHIHSVALALHQLPKPAVAWVDGDAVGAGCNLALGCDMVLATPDPVSPRSSSGGPCPWTSAGPGCCPAWSASTGPSSWP